MLYEHSLCCMSFQLWRDGILEGGRAAWVSFCCGRWMHGGYIEDVVADNDGFQNFCSFVLSNTLCEQSIIC